MSKAKKDSAISRTYARDFESEIREKVMPKDRRYRPEAYQFLFEALRYTQASLGKDSTTLTEKERHVTGQQLLDGIRQLAWQQFGPLSPTVFRSWGIRQTEDFGEMVFNLVTASMMSKTDSDSRQDFAQGFDFDKAFRGSLSVRDSN
jgi:uncharacterized repeat protein (TIGR04138 family)